LKILILIAALLFLILLGSVKTIRTFVRLLFSLGWKKRKEFFYGTVVRLFDVLREITGRQLILAPVISHAIAADPFARARIVRAITAFLVNLDLAFHLCDGLGSPKNRTTPSRPGRDFEC
jgi:hypothetical protein